MTVMCMTIATTFTVTWLPFQMNHLVLAYGNRAHGLMLIDALETMTYVNSCVNPIVYALMWRPFRLSFIQVKRSIQSSNYLRQGGYAFAFVCLSVERITQIVVDEF